jgi:hypothetical protein
VRNVAALLLMLLLVTACSTTRTAKPLEGREIPYDGSPIPADLWTAAMVPEKPSQLRTTIWPLPTTFGFRRFWVNPKDGTANSLRVSLGSLWMLILPYRAEITLAQYDGPDAKPTGFRSLKWNPFFTRARNEGEFQFAGMRFKSNGVPVFYSNSKTDFENGAWAMQARLKQGLWLLGPTQLGLAEGLSARYGGKEGRFQNQAKVFAPLYLGGPGSWLWLTTDVRLGNTNLEGAPNGLRFRGNGPVFGLGGYLFGSNISGNRSSNFRHVVLGLLWHDVNTRVDGKLETSRHGPLWSGFGWGHRDGRFRLRFLWFSI